MAELISTKVNESLSPMVHILDKKNISAGVNIIQENNKLYITLNKSYLSETNQVILETISSIYSETLFYSDNERHPSQDKLELWCPDEEYDERTHIRKRCRTKKLFVLELNPNNTVEVMGTTIMLANAIQEQNPFELEANKGLTVIDADMNKRHEHYINAEVNDSNWFNLTVSLNRNNPLCENPFAPFMTMCDLNSPVLCDNMLGTALVGMKSKIYIYFCTNEDELEKAIKEYFEQPETDVTPDEKKLDSVKQRLLREQ